MDLHGKISSHKNRTHYHTFNVSHTTMTRCLGLLICSLLLLFHVPHSTAFAPQRAHRYPTTTTLSHAKDSPTTGNRVAKTTQPTPILSQAVSNVANQAKIPLVTAATAAMLLSSSLPADAAMSGGRMGGSFSRSPSPSRSYGGGGRSSYYGGGSRTYYSRPSTTIVAPIVTPFYNPFYSPIVPFYGGGVGAISYARGPGLFDLLFLGGIGFLALSAVSNAISSRVNQWDDDSGVAIAASSQGTSVLRLNIALDVPNRDDPSSILSVLDRIANTTGKNTQSRSGVQQLTKQVALELLRRKSSISSAYGQMQYCKEDRQGQRVFNEWSVRERSKFEKENINRFGGLDFSTPRRDAIDSAISSKATMAVVTLVLSLEESLPKVSIQSLDDVERVLRQVASSDAAVLGAEILWTPEDRSEVLTRKEVLADYPELRAL
jgi:uncharacterized membrane protein